MSTIRRHFPVRAVVIRRHSIAEGCAPAAPQFEFTDDEIEIRFASASPKHIADLLARDAGDLIDVLRLEDDAEVVGDEAAEVGLEVAPAKAADDLEPIWCIRRIEDPKFGRSRFARIFSAFDFPIPF
jgi:hypothetical protein